MYSLPKSKNVDLKSATGVKNEFAKLTIVSTLNENKSNINFPNFYVNVG